MKFNRKETTTININLINLATKYLKEIVIPQFATELDTIYRGSDHSSEFWMNRSNFGIFSFFI
jgi:hypothetical protein